MTKRSSRILKAYAVYGCSLFAWTWFLWRYVNFSCLFASSFQFIWHYSTL